MRDKPSISAALAKQTSPQGVRRQPLWKLQQSPSNACSVPSPELGERRPQCPSRLALTPDDPSPLPAVSPALSLGRGAHSAPADWCSHLTTPPLFLPVCSDGWGEPTTGWRGEAPREDKAGPEAAPGPEEGLREAADSLGM